MHSTPARRLQMCPFLDSILGLWSCWISARRGACRLSGFFPSWGTLLWVVQPLGHIMNPERTQPTVAACEYWWAGRQVHSCEWDPWKSKTEGVARTGRPATNGGSEPALAILSDCQSHSVGSMENLRLLPQTSSVVFTMAKTFQGY